MASTEQLIFDIVTRDRASDGITKVGSAARDAAGNVDSLTRRLDDVGRKTATARLALAGDKDAQASLDKIDAKIVSLDRRTASPNITIEGAARATAEISAIDVELDKLGKKGGSADVATGAVGSGGLAGPGGILALVGAGVAVAPVIATVSVGLAGFGAAAAAAVAPVLAAGTATKAQQEALAGLDPAQRAAYDSLGALKGQFSGFTKELEPQVFGVFNQGLKLAGGLLGDVEPVAAATGKALGTVVGEIAADFKTQQWQQFFGWMAQTAGPDVQLLGGLFVALMNDLPPLLEQLQPLATMLINVGKDAATAAGDLMLLNPALNDASVTSAKVQTNSGNMFTRFLADSKTVLSQVTGIGKSTADAATGTGDLGAKAAAAAPQVGTLAGDMAILGSNTSVAADATKAFDDVWAILVGKSVSDQQAVLNMSAAFDSYNTSLKTNKANSTVAQQAFLSIITTMGSGLSTLQTNGATIGQLNSFYQANIDKLKALHNLTPAERKDVQDVTRDYQTWANTTGGLTKQVQGASDTIKTQFLSQLGSIAAHSPGVSTDISNLANSILKTGNQSSATRGDRAQLIADLQKAGLTADAARGLVNRLQGQIDALHGKTVTVATNLTGEGGLVASATGVATKFFNLTTLPGKAAGWRVPGYGGGDRWPVLVESGETIVPKHLTPAIAPLMAAHKVPGFTTGTLVGAAPWAAAQAGGDVSGWAGGQVKAWANAAIAVQAAKAAAAATAAANAFAATQGASGGIIQSLMKNMAAARGWTGSQWNALAAVENREAGWSMTARNPSSGAYGLAQFINGPSEYAQYGGNSTTAMGQITGMLNYIAQRYGNPQNAWNHEVNYGWYDKGGMLPQGLSLAYNGTGAPEPVIPARRIGGGDVHYHVTVNVPPTVNPRDAGRQVADLLLAHTKAGGRLYPAGTVPR